MIRVAIVTPFGRRLGGSDNILLSFLRSYDRRRIEPEVIFLERGPFEREVAGLGIATRALPGGRLRDPVHLGRTIAALRVAFRRIGPDLVLNWLSTAQVYGAPAALAVGLRRRTLWWQLDQRTGPRWSRDRVLDQVATALPAIAIGCCSDSVAAAQARVRPRRPTFSVLPGIAEPRRPGPEELAGLRARLGLPDGALVVGTIGRLFAWKGHHRLLEAVARLRQDGHEAHALVVGGGGHRGDPAYEARLRELAAGDALAGHVTFTGQVPDGAAYAALMDVFVNASTPEPFGLVLLEAMAIGVPVVAVDQGGPSEIVEDGRSGILARGGSPAELAEAIAPLLADDGLRARIAAAGRQRYEARFTEARMGAEMSRRLLELVPG